MKSRMLLLIALLPTIAIITSCSKAQKEDSAEGTAGKEHEHRAYLGVSLQDMSPERASEMKVKTETGALVNSVAEDSPAEEAGIEDDDIIVDFNGKGIEDANDLVRAVRRAKPGETAAIIALRKDEKKTFQVKLGKAPRERDMLAMAFATPHVGSIPTPHVRVFPSFASGAYGLEMMDLNKQLAEYFGAPDKKGVLIESVEKKSSAEKAGFKAGDVIVKIGKDRIEDTRDVWDALEDYKSGDKVSFEILRKGSPRTLSLDAEDLDAVGTFHRQQSFPWGDEQRLMYHYQNRELKGQMDKLRDELNTMTKKLREEARTIQSRVSREVRRWSGV